MGIHTADAMVLRRYPYRETSVIVTCLTDRFGKLKGLVKGLHVQPNRHRSAMEPMTLNRIVFYDTHNSSLHLISQCELVSPLSSLANDLDTMRLAAFCVELTDAVVPLEEPQPAVYRLLKDTLERAALGGALASLRAHFIIRVLRLAGFEPQLDCCTGCHAVVQQAGAWSARQGGLLCALCLHEDPHAETISPALLDALEACMDSELPVPVEAPVLPLLNQRLEEFLHWRLERPLKTMNDHRSSEFGVRNPELKTRDSEFRIPNSELPV
ncbi:MAG: DNA repair protein RecO [Candidatus Omnitrophota bacterium]|nr:DNA repair protein RecO [Candidatus Omnitrophota bacterium]